MRLIVDGNHLASRCRFARVSELVTSEGAPSGVVYGFLKSLGYVARKLGASPGDTIVVFDGGRSSRRMELYPEYKANRTPPDTDEGKAEQRAYYQQLDALREQLPNIGVRAIRVSGAEADDIISVVSHMGSTPTVIYSGDADFHPLACTGILLFDPKRELLTEEQILQIHAADSLEDILAIRVLVGDRTDNIVGVPKVGKKRAPGIVSKFRKQGWTVDPTDKWQHHCYVTHREVVSRNVLLMRLPRVWRETYYSVEQGEELMSQLSCIPIGDPKEFGRFCVQWELKELVDTFAWGI